MGTTALDERRAQVDVVLTNLSIGIPTDQDFIGDKLLPPLTQALSRVKIPKWGTEAFRIRDDRVGDYSEPDKLDIGVDTVSVDVDGHSLMAPVSNRHEQEAKMGPLRFDLEAEAVLAVVSQMDLSREKLQADLVTSGAIYAATHKIDLNGTSARWDDTSVDPADNIIPMLESTIPNDSGRRPNVLWMGQLVWAKLILNPFIRTRIFGTINPQSLPTPAQVAGLFGLSQVLVGRALSRDEAGAVTKLWGASAGLLYVPPTTGKRVPAFGYTIEQTMFGAGSEQVVKIPDEKMGASGGVWVKRSSFYTPASLFPDAGALFYNAVS